ncbi:MAG: M56 family metallopeptidase [Ndongobacter sp.]|nr:M56 family metallopeptidase [Ndongobacter sp.]
MSAFFIELLNRSMTASWIVLALLLARTVLFKRAKRFLVPLWGLVALRLLLPFSIESPFSLLTPFDSVAPMTAVTPPTISSGIAAMDQVIQPLVKSSFAPTPTASADPWQIWLPVVTALWFTGAVLLLGYAAVSYFRLHRRLHTAVRLYDNLYQSEIVRTPFILGLLHPRIYLPFALSKEEETCIVAHERMHLRRGDHLWKPLAFLLLALTWFHPLMWIAYSSLCRDIEYACDEAVISTLSSADRADYAKVLLAFSAPSRAISSCPLSFSEGDAKSRIRSILYYRKPTLWILLLVVLVASAIFFGFLTSPSSTETAPSPQPSEQTQSGQEEARLNRAIEQAVLAHNRSTVRPDSILEWPVESHVLLGKAAESVGKAESSLPNETVYALVCYRTYRFDSSPSAQLVACEGSLIPSALTFERRDDEYVLVDYRIPRDGADYASDIRKIFPDNLAEKAMHIQDYVEELEREIEVKKEQLRGTPEAIAERIASLLRELSSEPLPASDVEHYLEAHPQAYQELLQYGLQSMRFCINAFKKGAATGLDGQLMARLCQDIAQRCGEDLSLDAPSDGQKWFEQLEKHLAQAADRYTPEQLEKLYPVSCELLNLLQE